MLVFDKFLIDGEWVAPDGRGHFDVHDASTEEVIGRIPEIRQPFYALSVGRRIVHPGVVALTKSARAELFRRDSTP